MIVKPVSRLVQELDAKSFTVIGCPASDGLGGEAMQLFHAGLAWAEGDFVVVLGDASPLGHDPYYRNVAQFINASAAKPVHVLRGCRDGEDFAEYFGDGNRAVLSEEFTLMMLDNSEKGFSDETLKFLRETLAIINSRNIILAFNVPPPNRISGDSLPAGEWSRFEEAVGVWRNRISLLVCGHAHSYFEDEVDGLRLVVTGGGAKIQRIERVLAPPHHAVEIAMGGDGVPLVRRRFLTPDAGGGSPDVAGGIEAVYVAQCRAHVGNMLAAEDADMDGRPQLARLYRTAARSNLRQTRLIHRLRRWNADVAAAARKGIAHFGDDAEDARRGLVGVAEGGDVLAAQVLRRLGSAERVCAGLIERALEELSGGHDLSPICYYICHSCGMIFRGVETPSYCSECGAPRSSLKESD